MKEARNRSAENVVAGWLGLSIGYQVKHEKQPTSQPQVHPRKARRQKEQRINTQKGKRAIKAKYGPTGMPSKVTVKRLDTGEVTGIFDQWAFIRDKSSEYVERKAREAGFPNYATYLESPHWRQLRKAVLVRDKNRCRKCSARDGLQVHHRYYTTLGAEPLDSLETLCGRCHRLIHKV